MIQGILEQLEHTREVSLVIVFIRIILKETGLNKIVPVSHMNEHGSHNLKILDIKNIFQK